MLPSIFSLTQNEFCSYVQEKLGKGAYHATLVYSEWFRTGRVEGANPAFNNAKELLLEIMQLVDFSIAPVSKINTYDTTQKFLLQTKEGLEFESVVIPMSFGNTLCISSQVGCKMGCVFCETGRMGLLKNLSVEEIVAQVFHARFTLQKEIRNIVFMGMGEPLDNLDAVIKAVKILTDPYGLSLAKSHITISTSGLVEGIYRLIEEVDPAVNLAVSVNAPNDMIRRKIMPVNIKHDMQELYKAMQDYLEHPRRQILVEYVLLKGVNDSLEHAEQLGSYLRGLRVKVNLIPYNAQSRSRYEPPTEEEVIAFAMHLKGMGYRTLWRQAKGRDIMAACGQLGNVELRKKLFGKIEA